MTADRFEGNRKLSPAAIAEGSRIAEYTVIELIESGDCCDTYLAEDTGRSGRVKLTILKHRYAAVEEVKDRFLRTAQAALTVNHPGVVRLREVADYQGSPLVVGEVPRGRSLRDIIRGGNLTLPQILNISIQIGEALRAMHKAGLTGGDINPQHMYVDDDQVVCLAAFDWAGVPDDLTAVDTPELTERLGYLSPEQLIGEPVDSRSDIFSFGVVLYEMLTCRHPFRKAGKTATIKAIVESIPEAPSHFVIDMPDELESILNKALAKMPDQRYQHFNELLTDLKAIRAEETRQESEQLYRKLVERAYHGICIIQDKVIRFANRQLAVTLGRTVEELTGRPYTDFVTPDEMATVDGNYARHLAGSESPLLYESALVHASGRRIAVEISAGRIMYEGRPAILAFIRNITERKLTEETIQLAETQYYALFENMLEGAYQTLPDGTILSANPALVQMLGYDSEEELFSAVRAQDLYVDPEDRKILTQRLEDDGVLRNAEFSLKRKDGSVITVMENARASYDANGEITHYEGLLTDISERKEVEAQLRKLSSIVKQSLEGIALTDLDGNIEFVNSAFAEMHGYSPDELFGKNLSIFHTPEHLSQVEAANRQVKETGQFSGEIWHVHSDGTVFPAMMHNSLLHDVTGQPIGMIGTARDITELKRAEEAHRESQAMLQSIFRSAPVGIGLVSERILTWTNEKLSEITGYSSKELDGQSVRMLYSDDDEYERVGTEKYPQLYEQVTGSTETRFRHKDGKIMDILLSLTPIDPENHAAGVIFTALDITERKKAEETIRESEEKWRSLVENTDDILMVVDRNGCIQFVNKTIPPYTTEEVIGSTIYDLASPDVHDGIHKVLEEVFESGRPGSFLGYADIPDGGLRYFSSKIVPIKSEDKTVSAIWLTTDITERRQANKEIQEAHEQLNATLNALPDLLFEVDRHGRILDFRAPKPELLYVSPDEFLNKKMEEVIPEDAAEIVMGALWEAVDTGQSRGDVYSLNIGSELRWFELSVAAKGDPAAPEARFIMLVRDVTERHEGEIRLRKATEELRIERQALTEKNIALEQVLEHIETQRRSYQSQALVDIEKAIMPLVKAMTRKADSSCAHELKALEANLQTILTKDRDEFEARYAKLTSRESEICDLIRGGSSTKQISEKLNLSHLTVQKHREQIRKKLGITNTNINLATYLRTR